eukprot:scaffold67259_cov100-Cyclotella_meneghiniana.AAC.1
MVQPDDESISDGSHSSNEFMEVTSRKPTESLHPITVVAAPDKEGKRIAAKILLDQCCTDEGLISFEFAKKLGLSTRRADKDRYLTAAGPFETNEEVELSNCMLPCLSSNRTFSVTLRLIPEENSKSLNYGVILGQQAMRKFDIDTSITRSVITWGDIEIPMVSRNHWSKERLLLHKARLTKGPTLQSADEESEQPPQSDPNEVLETEALIATNYQKHDIVEYIATRTDLTEDQR